MGHQSLWLGVSSPVMVGDEIATPRIKNLVLDSNPKGPAHNGLNLGATWLVSNTDGGSMTRTGVMSFSTNAPPNHGGRRNHFDSTTGTIMFWMRSSGLADSAGFPATLFDRLSGSGQWQRLCRGAESRRNSAVADREGLRLYRRTPFSGHTLSNDRWHQVAVVYDQSSGAATHLRGWSAWRRSAFSGPWSWEARPGIQLGLSHDTNSWQAYIGMLDDVRFYHRVLTATEITPAYNGDWWTPTRWSCS